VGVVKGKPGYLAPEQAAGEPIDGRVDLFALGVTLHEALTGRRLFPTGDDAVALSAVFDMPIPKPSQLRPEVPPALDHVVMKLLERPLTTRTPSARVAREQLLEVTGAACAYPTGQRALSESVKRATAEWPDLARRAAEYAMAQAKTDVASSPVGSTDANKPLLPW
jgi:eukaryotic-like serine/threonine-protein kinase